MPLPSLQPDVYEQEARSGLYEWPDDQIIDIFDHADLWQFDIDMVVQDHLSSEKAELEVIWPASVSAHVVDELINLYINQAHPSMPVCTPKMLLDGLTTSRHHTDRHFAAFVLATCAFMSLQAQSEARSARLADMFLSEATRLYSIDNLGENSTIDTALACFHLFGALWTMGRDNAAWLRLQETINLARLLRIDELGTQDVYSEEWQSKVYLSLGLVVVERSVQAPTSNVN